MTARYAFDTIRLERDMPCTPERLFELMTSREARAVWGRPSPTARYDIESFDFRPGGREVSLCGAPDGPGFRVEMSFLVIDAPRLLICCETIDTGDGPAVADLVTQEVSATPDGARLVVTIQIAAPTRPDSESAIGDDFRTGWTGALGNLAALAAEA